MSYMRKKIIFFSLALMILYSNLLYAKMAFIDLTGYEWVASYIGDFVEKGILSGISSKTFSPGNNVKREEFIKVVVSLFPYNTKNVKCDFEDVNEQDWYYPYVAAGTNAGVINGIGNNKFGVGEYITRQDICTVLYRVLKEQGYDLKETRKEELEFLDDQEISQYAYEAIAKLYKAGVINGVDDAHMAPKSYATRAQMVKMVYLCNENKQKAKKIVEITSMKLNKNSLTLQVGKSQTLSVTIKPNNATNKEIRWYSDNDKVATVKDGKVEAKEIGEAIITVETEDGIFKAECKVTVTEKKSSSGGGGGGSSAGRTLEPTTEELNVEKQETSEKTPVEAEPEEKESEKTETKETTPVEVEPEEKESEKAETKETTPVEVEPEETAPEGEELKDPESTSTSIIEVTDIVLNKEEIELTVGKSEILEATVLPDDASNKKVIWTSSNEEIVKVENGKVTALKEGEAVITVKADEGDKEATCEVIVKKEETAIQESKEDDTISVIPVTKIKLDKSLAEIAKGKSVILKAIITPNNATNKKIKWTSSNTKVATVSNGKVTGKGAGVVTITAKSESGEKQAKCTVTVRNTLNFLNNNEISFSKVFEHDIYNLSTNSDRTQGFCTDGTFFYIALINKADDYKNETTVLVRTDLKGNVKATVKLGKIGHSNGLAYNPNTKKILIAPCSNHFNCLFQVPANFKSNTKVSKVTLKNKDGTNFLVKKDKTNRTIGSLTYDKVKKQYVVKTGQKSVAFFDNNFKYVKGLLLNKSLKNNDSYIGQAITCDGRYLYGVYNDHSSNVYINIYNLSTGKLITTKYVGRITTSGVAEIEQLCVNGNTFYGNAHLVRNNRKTKLIVYKIKLVK